MLRLEFNVNLTAFIRNITEIFRLPDIRNNSGDNYNFFLLFIDISLYNKGGLSIV